MKILLHLRDMVTGRELAISYGIAALTVVVCWIIIGMDGGRIKSNDEIAFFAIAQNLAASGDFAEEVGVPTAYRAPGLVFFLAPFVKLGAGLTGLRMANALLVGLSLIVLFHLVRRHGGPLAGLFAVALIPLWPVVIYTASTIYPQTLAAFALLLTVLALDRLIVDPSTRAALLAGLADGLLVLTIPVTLLLLPIFLGWIFIQSKRRMFQALVFCLMSGSLVCAWTARNYMTFNAFIPVATSSGYNLLAGNSPNTRYNTSLDVRFPEYVYTEITGQDEVERNRIFTRSAIQEISQAPLHTATLYVGKFLHWFHFNNKLISDEVVTGGASRVSISSREMVLFVSYAGIILPLLLHILLRQRFPFKPIEILFICLWVGAGLAYAIFFTRIRFRLPFDWLIIASNGIFLAALIEEYLARYKSRRKQS